MTPRMQIYRNAVSVKMKNRRVTVVDDAKANGILIECTVCDGSLDKRTIHNEIRGKAVKTSIKLSLEAMEALVNAYFELKEKEQYYTQK